MDTREEDWASEDIFRTRESIFRDIVRRSFMDDPSRKIHLSVAISSKPYNAILFAIANKLN